MAHTNSLEVAESNHLAWAMAGICSVHPSSLGFDKDRQLSFLRWKDVKVTRMLHTEGRFTATIDFPYHKGYIDGLFDRSVSKTIFPASTVENIRVDVTYRLLIILLRRGFLEYYASAEELLAADHFNITIADDHLQKPVFLATDESGMKLVLNSPAAPEALSEYLAKSIAESGLSEDLKTCPWGRNPDLKMVKSKGRDPTKGFIHYRPISPTPKQRQLDMFCDFNAARIACGVHSVFMEADIHSQTMVTLYRVELLMTPTQQHNIIEAFIKQYHKPDVADVVVEQQDLRLIASQELCAYAMEIYEDKFTGEQLNEVMWLFLDSHKLAQALYGRVQKREGLQQKLDNEVQDAADKADDRPFSVVALEFMRTMLRDSPPTSDAT